MTTPGIVIYLFAVFLGALLLTGYIRNYSLKHSIIDIPNERSSHTIPTPRGGGLSITLFVLATVIFTYCFQLISFDYTVALAGGGIIVAVIGWLDDHYDLSPVYRAAGYLIASIWALFWLGGLDAITFGDYILQGNIIVFIILVLSLAWLINLYNFMDGTDGLAASEAMAVAVFAGVLFFVSGEMGLAIITFSMVSACAGFFYWNKPPAKIFMGDVGSCCIGFIFGVLALLGEKTGTIPAIIWIILLSVFICDATFTLLMRFFKKENWYEAHRSHAYQRLVQMNVSHARLTVYVLCLNLFVIWPVAYVAYQWNEFSFYLMLAIIILMYFLWAGIQRHYNRHILRKTDL